MTPSIPTLGGDAAHCSLVKRFMYGLLEGQALLTCHAATNANSSNRVRTVAMLWPSASVSAGESRRADPLVQIGSGAKQPRYALTSSSHVGKPRQPFQVRHHPHIVGDLHAENQAFSLVPLIEHSRRASNVGVVVQLACNSSATTASIFSILPRSYAAAKTSAGNCAHNLASRRSASSRSW